MKTIYLYFVGLFLITSLYACRGDCFRCDMAGAQSQTYCEGDFTSNDAWMDQVNGLDSLGWDCYPK